MKKEYVTPKLRSYKLDCSTLLCNSLTVNIDNETEISDESIIPFKGRLVTRYLLLFCQYTFRMLRVCQNVC